MESDQFRNVVGESKDVIRAFAADRINEIPCVYVDIERELEELTIRLGSRIKDATVDRYVTWLKHTKRVEKVVLAKQNRYTT